MPVDRKVLGNALLTAAKSQKLVDMLATEATRLPFDTSVSRELALSLYKKDLAKVTAIAGSANTDPAVLEKYAKDTRVSVRDTLICNPKLPLGPLAMLTRWAAARQDSNLAAVGMRRLPPEEVVAILRENARDLDRYASHGDFANVVARKVRGNRELTEAALEARVSAVSEAILRDILVGDSNAIGPVEAYGLIPEGSRATLAARCMSSVTVLTEPVAAVAAAASNTTRLAYMVEHEQFALVAPGALEELSVGSPELAVLAMRLGLTDEHLRSEVLQNDSAVAAIATHLCANVAEEGRRTLHKDTERSLVRRLAEISAGDDSENYVGLIGALTHQLPERDLPNWLRSQGLDTFQEWLSTTGANRPRTGQLTALMKDPGSALKSRTKSRVQTGTGWRFETVREEAQSAHVQAMVASAISDASHAGTLDPLLADEARVLADQFIGANLNETRAAVLAMPRLEAILGEQMEAWETLFTLATDWSSGLEDLIHATVSLSGATRLDSDTRVEAAAASAPADEQLTLA